MRIKLIIISLFLVFAHIACSSESQESSNDNSSQKEKIAQKLGLTLFELDNGIGPIKEKIELGAINPELVEKGKQVFITKCTQCHKLDERYTGPALRDVTKRRSPEYIMNMILNPEEMTKRHPEARKLLAMFANQMTFQNVTKEDTRALLEYLRSEAK